MAIYIVAGSVPLNASLLQNSLSIRQYGRLTDTANPLGQRKAYAYDKMSRVTEVKDPAGNVTAYTYDALYRLTRKDIQTPAGVHAVTNYTYDAVGNMLSASNGESSVAFVYDALNRAVETRQSFAGKTYTISYAYDAVGNRTMMATPWGKYSYTYDVLNRVDSITNPQGIQVSFKYDAAGRRIGKTVFAAARNTAPLAETAYSYDAAGQLLNITNKASGKVVAFDNYTYDALGNRVSMEDQHGMHTYRYDASNRLIVSRDLPLAPFRGEGFAYDKAGNRRHDSVAKDYKYDAANRLLENTVYTYTHDQLGNLTSRTEKASSATITYAYSPENQLSNVVTPDAKVEYKYDPLGRRIEKSVNADTARFLYDGQNIIADLNNSGTQANTYTNGPGIDEPLIIAKPDGKSYHYHADALGSITAITDNAGATIETYQYKAYGTPTIKNSTGAIIPASLIGNTRMFTAREYEPETGHYNNRRRYQDPDRGAFTQEDPIGFAGGDMDLYRYVFNSPVKYTDPNGEILPVLAPIIIGAGLGATSGFIGSVLAQKAFYGCVDWKSAGVSALVGGLTGALMPIFGGSYFGAGALGMMANTVQYSMTASNFSWSDLTISAGIGIGSGLIGGPFVKSQLVSGLLPAKENVFAATPWWTIASVNTKGYATGRAIGAAGASSLTPSPR